MKQSTKKKDRRKWVRLESKSKKKKNPWEAKTNKFKKDTTTDSLTLFEPVMSTYHDDWACRVFLALHTFLSRSESILSPGTYKSLGWMDVLENRMGWYRSTVRNLRMIRIRAFEAHQGVWTSFLVCMCVFPSSAHRYSTHLLDLMRRVRGMSCT